MYRRWRRKQDVVLRQDHKAGEKLFVGSAGPTIPIHDPRRGPVQQAHLFVAVLGGSSHTYAEATADEQLASWISAHVRAFEFYEGVPKLVVLAASRCVAIRCVRTGGSQMHYFRMARDAGASSVKQVDAWQLITTLSF